MTKQERRNQKAIEIMNTLDIYKPYIQAFKDEGKVCIFEFYGGFYDYQRKEIEEKRKWVEKRFNCTVYAITHEIMSFGECYDFLLVTNEPEEWDELVMDYENNCKIAFAYVWNKDAMDCSELGDILVNSRGGGIKRVG